MKFVGEELCEDGCSLREQGILMDSAILVLAQRGAVEDLAREGVLR